MPRTREDFEVGDRVVAVSELGDECHRGKYYRVGDTGVVLLKLDSWAGIRWDRDTCNYRSVWNANYSDLELEVTGKAEEIFV